jgi:hypothetical protein
MITITAIFARMLSISQWSAALIRNIVPNFFANFALNKEMLKLKSARMKSAKVKLCL